MNIFDVFKEMLTSKKFLTAIASTIAGAAMKLGLEIPVEDIATVLAPMMAYILSQGWADSGKEAVKLENQ